MRWLTASLGSIDEELHINDFPLNVATWVITYLPIEIPEALCSFPPCIFFFVRHQENIDIRIFARPALGNRAPNYQSWKPEVVLKLLHQALDYSLMMFFHTISFSLLFDKIPHDWSMLRPSKNFHKTCFSECRHDAGKARDAGEITLFCFDWIPFNNLCAMLFYNTIVQIVPFLLQNSSPRVNLVHMYNISH